MLLNECNKKISPREFELDCLRIIAVLAIIMIHCAAPYVTNFPRDSFNFVIGNFFDSISRIGVPFFVIISGYFMLNENKELSILKIKSKILKLFLILGFWSLFYALVYHFKSFLNAFIYGHYHLWFLYMLIGLYLITPILRLFVKKENKNYIYYLIILSLIFYFIPPVLSLLFSNDNEITKLAELFSLNFAGTFISYYLIGYLFRHDYSIIKKYIKYIILIVLVALFSIFSGAQFIETKIIPYKIFYANGALPVFLYSVSFFVVLYNFFEQIEPKVSNNIKKVITETSKLTFGIYLVHASLLKLWQSIFKNVEINVITNIIMIYILTIISSFIITFILSKIKYVNQLIKL